MNEVEQILATHGVMSQFTPELIADLTNAMKGNANRRRDLLAAPNPAHHWKASRIIWRNFTDKSRQMDLEQEACEHLVYLIDTPYSPWRTVGTKEHNGNHLVHLRHFIDDQNWDGEVIIEKSLDIL